MKDLNRLEYLQLAASVLPKEEIVKRYLAEHPQAPLESLYDELANELFLMARCIQDEYIQRYRHLDEDDFELSPDSILNLFHTSA